MMEMYEKIIDKKSTGSRKLSALEVTIESNVTFYFEASTCTSLS